MKIAITLLLAMASTVSGAQELPFTTTVPATMEVEGVALMVSANGARSLLKCSHESGEWGTPEFKLSGCELSEGASLDEVLTILVSQNAQEVQFYRDRMQKITAVIEAWRAASHKPLHAPQRRHMHRPTRKSAK